MRKWKTIYEVIVFDGEFDYYSQGIYSNKKEAIKVMEKIVADAKEHYGENAYEQVDDFKWEDEYGAYIEIVEKSFKGKNNV